LVKKLLALAVIVFVVVAGVVAYSFLKTPEAASGPIEAIPINVDTGQAVEAGSADEESNQEAVIAAADTPAASAPAEAAEIQVAPGAATNAGTEAVTTGGPADEVDRASGEAAAPLIFEIVPSESEARFLIDEVLRGQPITVVGATDQVAGQFAIDPADLSTVQMGVVQVNARTLATDNQFRNRAIKNRILLTDTYEFVTFTPTEVVGLPETGAAGGSFSFQVLGELTVTDVTRPVTFDITATAVSETRIEGTATTAFL
jgi:polyisoprenoid-binding protein YceI